MLTDVNGTPIKGADKVEKPTLTLDILRQQLTTIVNRFTNIAYSQNIKYKYGFETEKGKGTLEIAPGKNTKQYYTFKIYFIDMLSLHKEKYSIYEAHIPITIGVTQLKAEEAGIKQLLEESLALKLDTMFSRLQEQARQMMSVSEKDSKQDIPLQGEQKQPAQVMSREDAIKSIKDVVDKM